MWQKSHSYVVALLGDIHGRRGLEFGCNVGATAVMLHHLGATVVGVDCDPRCPPVARANAARYGKHDIEFSCIPAGAALPLPSAHFDFVTCHSVLEYVDPAHLWRTLSEIDRVLAPGGVLLVLATSNRLFPVEVHSRGWLSNYLPRSFDGLLGCRQRGIFPWEVTKPLKNYVDLMRADRGQAYFAARRSAGDGTAKILAARMLAVGGRLCGLSCGAVTPSFSLALRKPN